MSFEPSLSSRRSLVCARCKLSIMPGQETTVCPDCNGIHHWRCWQAEAGCSMPECKSRSAGTIGDPSTPEEEPVISISENDLDRAVPLRIITPQGGDGDSRRSSNSERRSGEGGSSAKKPYSGLAIASFLTALAGIPLFGLATGLVAVVLGLMAVASLRSRKQRGIGLAAMGVALGGFDVIAWGVAIVYFVGPAIHEDQPLEDMNVDVVELENLDPPLKRAMQANVLIESHNKSGWMASSSIGSGIVLKIENKSAWILTNRHVVDPDFTERTNTAARGDALRGEIRVKMVDQKTQPATVLWTAPDGVDLAVVQTTVLSDKIQAADWAAGVEPRIGDNVFAVGNPQGLGWTHTQGTVSQFRLQPKGARQVRMIQTSTAINHGNSGGGLYDAKGRLIGINTATIDKRVGEGLSFAISFETFVSFDVPFLRRELGNPPLNAP